MSTLNAAVGETSNPRGHSSKADCTGETPGTQPRPEVESLGWFNVPLAMTINFIFLALDQLGSSVEDPFENRDSDVALTSISRTIEQNLKEMLDHAELPLPPEPVEGIVY